MSGILAAVYLLWALSVLCAIDSVRRPQLQWIEADRNRSWWMPMLIVNAIVPVGSIFFVPAYVFGVVPRLSGRATSNSSEFSKRR
jgi:hypothetical protein